MIVAIGDPPGQRFVAAMLAPGLGDAFPARRRSDRGRACENGSNRLHLVQRKIKLPFALSRDRAASSISIDRHRCQCETVRGPEFQPVEFNGPTMTCSIASLANSFEHRRSTRSAGNPRTQYLRNVRTAVASIPKSAIAVFVLWATGSITPGLGSTCTTCAASPRGCRDQLRIADAADHGPLDDRVAQQFAGDAFDGPARAPSMR